MNKIEYNNYLDSLFPESECTPIKNIPKTILKPPRPIPRNVY